MWCTEVVTIGSWNGISQQKGSTDSIDRADKSLFTPALQKPLCDIVSLNLQT